MQAHEQAPLAEIEAWSEVPGTQPLFESLLVLQNLPLDGLQRQGNGRLELRNYQTGITASSPLTIVVTPAERWSLSVIYDAARFSETAIRQLAAAFESLLQAVVLRSDGLLAAWKKHAAAPLSEWHQGKQSPSLSLGRAASSNGAQQTYLPARNRYESKLVTIWEDILGVHPVGVRDDFFEIGGRSLAAVRLFAAVEAAFGKQLPLAALWENRTIETLAQAFADHQDVTPWTSLVPVQPRGTKPPLFFVHTGGSHALFYGNVVRHLHADQPIYALHPPGLDGTCPPLVQLAEIARHFISEMRSIQPEGPYYLAGHCLGAYTAFEMAQQLTAGGEQVALLAILDAWPPQSAQQIGRLDDRLGKAFHHAARLDHRRIAASVWAVVRRQRLRLSRWAWGRWAAFRSPWIRRLGSLHRRRLLYLQEVQEACLRAGSAYVPQPYPGRLTVVHTQDTKNFYPFWRRLAAESTCHEMPGGHRVIFDEPYAAHLAKILEGALQTSYEVARTISRNRGSESTSSS